MREALIDTDKLTSPSVGTWRPSVAVGAPLSPGLRLGELLRDGRALVVLAPPGVGGVATSVAAAGAWVSYEETLVSWGDGALGVAAIGATVARAGGPDGATAVCAETDGTVYLSSEPGAAAFVSLDAQVAANATLALIEVMKTFTPVRAPFAGAILQIDVTAGQSVREGQPLFWLRA